MSTWLVAHLADLLHKVGVIEADPTATVSLRDYFVLAYTDALSVDESLWRIVVDYLDSCGDEGRLRMERVLKGVKLGDKASDDMSESEAAPNVEEVLRICAQYGLSDVANTICQVRPLPTVSRADREQSYSESLIEQRRYGEAVSYCIRAADSKQQIARIADLILDEYVVNGAGRLPPQQLTHARPRGIHLARRLDPDVPPPRWPRRRAGVAPRFPRPPARLPHRLDLAPQLPRTVPRIFCALRTRRASQGRRAARSHLQLGGSTEALLRRASDVADHPADTAQVLLLDLVPLLEGSSRFTLLPAQTDVSTADELLVTLDEAYDLLRCLEEIVSPIAARKVDLAGNLDSLARIIGSQAGPEGTRQAMKQLEVVRGALAR